MSEQRTMDSVIIIKEDTQPGFCWYFLCQAIPIPRLYLGVQKPQVLGLISTVDSSLSFDREKP